MVGKADGMRVAWRRLLPFHHRLGDGRTHSFLLLTGSPFHSYKSTDFMSSSESQRIVVRCRTNLHSNYKLGNKL